MTDTKDLIAKVRAALAEATPGPWRLKGLRLQVSGAERVKALEVVNAKGGAICQATTVSINEMPLIAAAPTWLAELCTQLEQSEKYLEATVAEIESLRAEVERLKSRDEYCACCKVGLLTEDKPPLCETCHGTYEEYDDGSAHCWTHMPEPTAGFPSRKINP